MKIFSGCIPFQGWKPSQCLESLKEGVFVASEGAVDFGSARGLRVESYTWHLSSAEIEAGFQHLNLLCFSSSPMSCLQGMLQDFSFLD